MGDVSIIARRLSDGHVQYGWSGNGGYFKNTGLRLLDWYRNPDDVEYLFSLGETALIGKPGSEHGGASLFMTHDLTGVPFHLGKTEREIFSRIAFVDYGYFYDTDNEWYYIVPGPFRIKIPLVVLHNVIIENDLEYEFDFLRSMERDILQYMLNDYAQSDDLFTELLESRGGGSIVWNDITNHDFLMVDFWKLYKELFNYFDDWIVAVPDQDMTKILEFKLHKKEKEHIETIEW